MRAFVVRELKHPSKISLQEDVPVPNPGPKQVLVDVFSTGLNFFDVCGSTDSGQWTGLTTLLDLAGPRKISEQATFTLHTRYRIFWENCQGLSDSGGM